MSWLNKRNKVSYYGLEYLHPQDDFYDFIFVHDYIFSTRYQDGAEIFQKVLKSLYFGNQDLCWLTYNEQMMDDGEPEYTLFFSCSDETLKRIEYTMDAWTDGWGYAIEKLDS